MKALLPLILAGCSGAPLVGPFEHTNGLDQSWYDDTPQGVYSASEATAACGASGAWKCSPPLECPSFNNAPSEYAVFGNFDVGHPECAAWIYQGPQAGSVWIVWGACQCYAEGTTLVRVGAWQ